MDEHDRDERSKEVKKGKQLLPDILARVSKIVGMIIAAKDKHGDIKVSDDGTIEIRADYLHPNLIAATKFRESDYNPEIRNPAQDHIFLPVEFPVRVRRHVIRCLISQSIVASEEIATSLVDSLIYISRRIVAEILDEALATRLREPIIGQIEERTEIFYDHNHDFDEVPIDMEVFRSRPTAVEDQGGSPLSDPGQDTEFPTDPGIGTTRSSVAEQGSQAA
ncbi:MAG: hypothetical protein WCT46_01080 [Candidatus Gracilibacteria bacterium]